jgi:plastocyanin
MIMKHFIQTVCLGLSLAGAAGAVGCHSTADFSNKDSAITLQVKASSHSIVVGETVTFFSRVENTLGRSAKLEWSTTGGSLKTEEEGRVARVMFDKPGTYTVTAVLSADGHEVDRSATDVEVKPMP